MKASKVAKEWGVSTRTVQRLVEIKLLPAEERTQEVPIGRYYSVTPAIVSHISHTLKNWNSKGTQRRVAFIKAQLFKMVH